MHTNAHVKRGFVFLLRFYAMLVVIIKILAVFFLQTFGQGH